MTEILSRHQELIERVALWLERLGEIDDRSERVRDCLSTMAEVLRVRGTTIRHEYTDEVEAARMLRESVLMVERFQARIDQAVEEKAMAGESSVVLPTCQTAKLERGGTHEEG